MIELIYRLSHFIYEVVPLPDAIVVMFNQVVNSRDTNIQPLDIAMIADRDEAFVKLKTSVLATQKGVFNKYFKIKEKYMGLKKLIKM